MAWRKAPPELVALFDRAIPAAAGIERRKMFGYPAAFTAGRLFAGLHQESFILRLGDADRAQLIEQHGALPFEPMPGRRMREYVALPAAILADPQALQYWIGRARRHARSQPAASTAPKRRTKR